MKTSYVLLNRGVGGYIPVIFVYVDKLSHVVTGHELIHYLVVIPKAAHSYAQGLTSCNPFIGDS